MNGFPDKTTAVALCLLLLPALAADTVKTQKGHVFSGEVTEQTPEFTIIVPDKCAIRKKEIRNFTPGTLAAESGEFFGKLELRDGSKILGWMEKLPNGDAVVKRHVVFGENHVVTRKEILKISAVGKSTLHLDGIGEISGFLSGENPDNFMFEMRDKQSLRIEAKDLAGTTLSKPKSPAPRPAEGVRLKPKYILGLVAGAGVPMGTFTQYLKRGYGGGADYLQAWPALLDFLGYWVISGRFQLYEGDLLKIYYGQLYAGLYRSFPVYKDHGVYGKLTAGINFEQIRERDSPNPTSWAARRRMRAMSTHGEISRSWQAAYSSTFMIPPIL